MFDFDRGGIGARRTVHTLAFVLALLLMSSGAPLYGSPIYWTGLTGKYWYTFSNWYTGARPGSGDDVYIDSTHYLANKATTVAPNALGQDGSSTVNTLHVGSGFSVTVKSTNVLFVGTVNGSLTILAGGSNAGTLAVNAGALTIQGMLTNTGTVQQTGGTLNLGTSSSAGTISGGTVSGTITNTYGTLNGTTLSSGSTVNNGIIAGTTTANGITVNSARNTGAFHAAANNNTWTGGSNSGTMDRTGGNLTIAGSFTNTGTVTGATITGQVTNTNGTLSGTTLSNGSSVTNGTIAGTTTANGTSVTGAANTGAFHAAANNNTWTGGSNSGTMDRTGGNLTIAGGFTNTGTVTGASISGSVTNTSGILDTVSLNDVTLTGGTLQGTNTADGTNALSNFANAGTLNVNSGNTTLSGTVDGGGAINVGEPATLVLSNGTQFDGGGLTVNGGTVAVQGTVDPLDTFTLNGGTLNLDGTLEVTDAFLNSGIVTGTGSFGSDTNLHNSGVDLYVGGYDTIGHWILNSYIQSGTGSLNFDILDKGQDWITLTNGGTLNGSISLNFDYSGPLKHFALISGLQGDSNVTFGDLPKGWTYSLTDGTLALNAASTPDPPTVMLLGGALAALGSLRRRMKKKA